MNKSGKIISVSGPVVNIVFPEHPPLPGDVLETIVLNNGKEETLLLETVITLSSTEVRAVALDLAEGVVRGQHVTRTERKQKGITIVNTPDRNMAMHAAVAIACSKMPNVMVASPFQAEGTPLMEESSYPEDKGLILCGHPLGGATLAFLENSLTHASSGISRSLLSTPESEDSEPNRTAFPLYGLNPNDVFRKNKRKKRRT